MSNRVVLSSKNRRNSEVSNKEFKKTRRAKKESALLVEAEV